MIIKDNPIFTAHDVRRAAAAGLVSENIHVAQLGADEARWVADLEHGKEILTVNLFAIGVDYAFTPDRGVEVEVTSRHRNRTLVRFSTKETPLGISYVEQVSGSGTEDPFKVDYAFKSVLTVPRQVTARDLVKLGNVRNLTQNQTLIADVLNLAGVPLIAPRSKK